MKTLELPSSIVSIVAVGITLDAVVIGTLPSGGGSSRSAGCSVRMRRMEGTVRDLAGRGAAHGVAQAAEAGPVGRRFSRQRSCHVRS